MGYRAFFRDDLATIIQKKRLNTKNVWQFISEKCVVIPQFSFWILIALAKICFFHIVINRAKIFLYQWANSLRNPNTRDAQNVCAVTKGGTVLKSELI